MASDSLPIAPAEPKKPAWNRPNGPADTTGPTVIAGAVSWPALSESTKPSPRSSDKPIPDCHVSSPLDHPNIDYSPKLNPSGSNVMLSGPPDNPNSPKPNSSGLSDLSNTNYPPKVNLSGSDTTSAVNHAPPAARQRSMKRGGGNAGVVNNVGGGNSGTIANGEILQIPPRENPHGVPQISPREHSGRNAGGWEHRPRGESHRGGHGGNRRGNNGGGGGDRQNNYGNRWDTEGYNHRGHMQQRGPRPIMRPHPQPAPAYFAPVPPAVHSAYANPPVVYSELGSPLYYFTTQSPTGVSFIPYPVSPQPMFVPSISSHQAAILKQIEYYFSPENLCKDMYLRNRMDENGWVPISFVAGFNKVKQLTDNVKYILETVRLSATVEVQGESVRIRNDWTKWVLPSKGNQYATGSAQQAPATHALDGQVDGL